MPKMTPRLVAGSTMSPCGGGRGWSSSSIPSTEPRGKAVARKGAGGTRGSPWAHQHSRASALLPAGDVQGTAAARKANKSVKRPKTASI